MEQITKTKFTHNQKVIIKLGYYAGYKATIQEYRMLIEESDLNGELPKNKIEYKLKLDNLRLEEDYWLPEQCLYAYKKYILF